MSEENQQQPAETGASEQQPAADLVTLGTAGDVIAAPVLETLTGGASEDVVEVVPDYASMSAGDMLQAVGDDAKKWAEAFMQTFAKVGPDAVDEALMIGWFASAIEHSGDVRRWAREKADADPLRAAHDAIEALLTCVGRLRVLDRLEPDTHAKATGALADLKARLGL